MRKIPSTISGASLLADSLLNKGTAFTEQERNSFGLDGLLPYHISSIEEQIKRTYADFSQQKGNLAKYAFLHSLQNRNETLFFRFLIEYLQEMVPLIYTPTVGDISLNYSILYREQRGLYLSYPLRKKMREMVENFPCKEIDVIVVTDGERILGLGDLGVGGMAIPVGKLNLYTVFGGIHPAKTLPIVLDVGTNNPKLLEDPLYIGWRHPRIAGAEYEELVEQFIVAIQECYPHVLLQWEDFSKQNAFPILEKYRKKICSFNDDIQGTAAVVLAGIYSAIRRLNSPLEEQRFVILGGGSAGLGIANQILQALLETKKLSKEEALSRCFILDRRGLLVKERKLSPAQEQFAISLETIKDWKSPDPLAISLLEVVENVKPTILIGVSTQKGAFDERVIKRMCQFVKHPIIFPLSNPTSLSEADPNDLLHWTNGTALIATGSPFPPVMFQGKQFLIGQCNNVYIFPGVGLGLIASKAKFASDKIFIEAAKILSEYSTSSQSLYPSLFPPLESLREISRHIAVAVAKAVISEGHSSSTSPASIEELIDNQIWFPEYTPYLKRD